MNISDPKAQEMVVVVVVVVEIFLVDHALDVLEVLDVAGDGDGSFVIEAVLRLSLLEQLHKQRVVHVRHRYHEPFLLLLPLHPYPYRNTPFRDHHLIMMLMVVVVVVVVVVMEMEIRHVQMEALEIFVDADPHL